MNENGIPIIDCHVHMRGPTSFGNLWNIHVEVGLTAANILSVACFGDANVNQNTSIALYKLMHPEAVYAFGGLEFPPGVPKHELDFEGQARRLLAMGLDGMKMMDGKPDIRKEFGERLDAPIFHDYYGFLEESGAPLLMHVADPAEMWKPGGTPAWAAQEGWDYSDGSFPSLDDLYGEVEALLTRFPRLNLILAHFYFMSDNPERAAEFLDRWPTVSFDLAPGTMFGHFGRDPELWADFFSRYADRILFGTDNSGGTSPDNPEKVATGVNKIADMRSVLEKTDGAQWRGAAVGGMGLDAAVLRKVYHDNFIRYAGPEPRPVDVGKAIEEGERGIAAAKSRSEHVEFVPVLKEIAEQLKGFA